MVYRTAIIRLIKNRAITNVPLWPISCALFIAKGKKKKIAKDMWVNRLIWSNFCLSSLSPFVLIIKLSMVAWVTCASMSSRLRIYAMAATKNKRQKYCFLVNRPPKSDGLSQVVLTISDFWGGMGKLSDMVLRRESYLSRETTLPQKTVLLSIVIVYMFLPHVKDKRG